MTRMPVIQSKAEFVKWIRLYHPTLYARAVQSPAALSDISDTLSKVFDNIGKAVDIVAQGGKAYIEGKAALDLVKVNIKRAKSGLAPYESFEDAQAGESAGAGGGMFANIDPIILYGGLGLVAFLILRRR